MDNDEREWKQAVYERAIANQELKAMAWQMAERESASESVALGPGDMEAARRYLRVCMRNMSVYELQTVATHELAGLLARGALGAARFRAERATRGVTPASPGARRRERRDR